MIIDPGIATLIAASISAIAALSSLFISLKIQRKNIHLETYLKTTQEIGQEKRNLLYQQLSEFYDPIFTLLSVNQTIFERIGPESNARLNSLNSGDEVKNLWRELRQSVIIPNNMRICQIVESKLHLLSPDDNVNPYFSFTTHAYSFKAFKKLDFEQYELFPNPEDFRQHVQNQRDYLKKKIDAMMKTDQKSA